MSAANHHTDPTEQMIRARMHSVSVLRTIFKRQLELSSLGFPAMVEELATEPMTDEFMRVSLVWIPRLGQFYDPDQCNQAYRINFSIRHNLISCDFRFARGEQTYLTQPLVDPVGDAVHVFTSRALQEFVQLSSKDYTSHLAFNLRAVIDSFHVMHQGRLATA